ncbi:MAG: TAXI family TRAP transporter solute-binding subunit [Desulforhopalus sp.]
MSKIIVRLSVALVFFFISVGYSCAERNGKVSMGIVTGGLKGTYYQFGLNLEKLMEQNGITLNVANSNGSVENVFAVYKRPNTQMGIVQSDVLAFVAKVQTDPVLKKIAKKIKMVYPLYNEEVHLLGQGDIADFDNLEGKKVAIGQEGSGTYLTAKLLFEISDIKPSEMLTVGAGEALPSLKAGDIDAMFYVAGFPVKLFSEQVTAEDNLKLIPIMNKSIIEFYPKAEIPANTYTWQTETVQSVAVKSVLVSYDFRMTNCYNVGNFANILETNIDWLRENGHPKWNSVDLDYPLKGWEQYGCVKNFPGRLRKKVKQNKPDGINPVLEAIKQIL